MNIDGDSCLNGWAFGNIAASSRDIAKFYLEYLGSENLINKTTAAQLMDFDYMTDKRFNISYGLGIIPVVFDVANGSSNPNHVYPNYPANEIIGHLGEDWGSAA
jgi:hypothetical protein